ncbi:MAG: glycosyltransferase family 4 protein [Thermoanaerobaculia bacterium]
MITTVLHVSSGMNEDGGGTAHLGRLIGASLRRHCARHRLEFRGLHLPALDGSVATDGYASFGGSRLRLTAAVVARMALAHRRTALYFDHVGPARALSLLPPALLPRYAIQLHGIEIWRELSRDRRQVLENATFLVANSAYTAARALEFLPARHRLRIVPLGIEPPLPSGPADGAVLARAGAGTGAGYALIVGRMAGSEGYKGHDELLEAWPEVLRRLPGARLVVAGSGNDLARLRAKAGALGLTGASGGGDAVCFTGQIDPATLGELYRRAALFVLPSRHEGFGLVFAEAMAAGKPCLALQGTAPAEIVVDGETGRLVPQNDLAALGDALVELLGDPEKARKMGEAGRRRYEREFTAAAFGRRFQPVIEELVGG